MPHPILSLILSFIIPGLGQLANGDIGKGIIIFSIFIPVSIIIPQLAIFVWLYGVYDAYVSAKRSQKPDEYSSSTVSPTPEPQKSRIVNTPREEPDFSPPEHQEKDPAPMHELSRAEIQARRLAEMRARNTKKKTRRTDSWIDSFNSIPAADWNDLETTILRTYGSDGEKIACLILLRKRDYFKVPLNDSIKIKIRFVVTETPFEPVIANYIKVYDSPNPGLDEVFQVYTEDLKRLCSQNFTYVFIADPNNRVYLKRKIIFDDDLKSDMRDIEEVLDEYGIRDEHAPISEHPGYFNGIKWYLSNYTQQEIDAKYF